MGDSNVDIRTAKNGNLTSCGVLWGFRSRQELEARLEPSPWPDYPLYLPNPKPLCLLAIPAAQLKEDPHG